MTKVHNITTACCLQQLMMAEQCATTTAKLTGALICSPDPIWHNDSIGYRYWWWADQGLEKVMTETSPLKIMNSSSHTIYYILFLNIHPLTTFPTVINTFLAYTTSWTLRNLKIVKKKLKSIHWFINYKPKINLSVFMWKWQNKLLT